MPEKPDEPLSAEQADEAVAAAQEQLEEAQQARAEVARGGMDPLIVKVLPGNTLKDEFGEHHGPGSTFAVDGLTAVALAQGGHVTITGTGSEPLPDDDERRKAAAKAEEKHLRARLKAVTG